MIPVICIIILPLNSRPEKKSGPEILKLERVVYLAMENDFDRLETSTTRRVFDDHMCQGKGVLGFAVFRNFRVFQCGLQFSHVILCGVYT